MEKNVTIAKDANVLIGTIRADKGVNPYVVAEQVRVLAKEYVNSKGMDGAVIPLCGRDMKLTFFGSHFACSAVDKSTDDGYEVEVYCVHYRVWED